jgi:putative heme-binding domain-containing protein
MRPLVTGSLLATAGVVCFLGVATTAAQQQQPEHAGQYSQADIQAGSVVYSLQCSQCHGPTGDQVGGIDLRSGRFRNNVSNDDDLRRIITNGIPNTSMPGRKLAPAELTAVVAYIRNMRDFNTTVVKMGDSGRGRTLVEGNGCGSCHRIGATGSRVASDLSEIGSSRSPAAIQQALLDPSSLMMPINRPVRVVTKDGRTITGRRLNEDTFTIQMLTDKEQLLTVQKADLKEFTIQKTASMPSFKDKLDPQQLADVVAYLASLRAQGRGGAGGRQGGPPPAGGAPPGGGRQGPAPGR